MLAFKAHSFVNIARSIHSWEAEISPFLHEEEATGKEARFGPRDFLLRIQRELSAIGCTMAAKAAHRLANDLGINRTAEELRVRFEQLHRSIYDEMESQVFLWVPPQRSEYYTKNAQDILGHECATLFPSLIYETEEASKCFAAGRFTASAFHLMRMTEAAIKAFAGAINFVPSNDNWGKVFDEFDKQSSAPPKTRTGSWLTHGDFLKEVSGDLRAVKNAWRNEVMHLDAVYDEEQARHLLTVIPAFMRHIATRLDQGGNLR